MHYLWVHGQSLEARTRRQGPLGPDMSLTAVGARALEPPQYPCQECVSGQDVPHAPGQRSSPQGGLVGLDLGLVVLNFLPEFPSASLAQNTNPKKWETAGNVEM